MKVQPWIRAAFWLTAMAVLVLTLLPVEHLPLRGPFDFWDKAQHALASAVLAGLAVLDWPEPALRWRLLFSLVALGGAIEVVQHLSGWRHGEWADWAADAVGVVLVGLLLRSLASVAPLIIAARTSLTSVSKRKSSSPTAAPRPCVQI